MASTIGTAYVQIVPSAQGITKSVTNLLDPAGTTAGKSMGSKIGSGLSSFFKSSAMVAVGNLAAKAFSAAANTITSSLSGAVSRVDTMSNYSNIMKGLGYSASDAKEQIAKLTEGIEGLPTTLDGIVTIQQQFTALTGSMDEATKLSLALNNATLAGGQGAEVASSAMQQWYQVIANGVPDLQSWRIINAAMPAQLNQLAQSILGASATSNDLFKAWQAGTVTTEQVTDALVTLNEEGGDGITAFSEQALTGTAGISTAMQNMKTAVTKNVANIIEALNGGENGSNITSIFSGLKSTINAFGSSINSFLAGHSEAISKVASSLKTLLDPNSIYDPSKMQSLTDGILELMVGLANNIINLLPSILQKVLDFGASLLNSIGLFVPSLIETILMVIPQLIQTVVSTVPSWIEAALQLVNGLAMGILQALPVLLETMPQVIDSMITGLISAIPQILETAVQIVLALVDGIVQNLPSIVQSAVDIVYTLVGTLTNATTLFQLLSAAITIVLALVEGILSNLPYIISASLSIINSLSSGLLQFLPQVLKAIGSVMLALVSAIIANIPTIAETAIKILSAFASYLISAIPKVVSAAKNIPEKIRSVFTGLISNAKTWGSDFMNAFTNSIKAKINNLVSTIKGVANKIRSFLHFSRPDEGPLRDYETWMPDMVEGLAGSLKKRSHVLTDAVQDLAGDMVLSPSMSVGAFSEMSNPSSSTTVTMNIYGAEGQDVNALADIIEKRLAFNMRKAAAAW